MTVISLPLSLSLSSSSPHSGRAPSQPSSFFPRRLPTTSGPTPFYRFSAPLPNALLARSLLLPLSQVHLISHRPRLLSRTFTLTSHFLHSAVLSLSSSVSATSKPCASQSIKPHHDVHSAPTRHSHYSHPSLHLSLQELIKSRQAIAPPIFYATNQKKEKLSQSSKKWKSLGWELEGVRDEMGRLTSRVRKLGKRDISTHHATGEEIVSFVRHFSVKLEAADFLRFRRPARPLVHHARLDRISDGDTFVAGPPDGRDQRYETDQQPSDCAPISLSHSFRSSKTFDLDSSPGCPLGSTSGLDIRRTKRLRLTRF